MLTDELPNQTQLFVRGKNLQRIPEPERESVVLDGWFHDTDATDELEYYTEIFSEDVTLYGAWINEYEGSAYLYTALSDGTVEITSYTGRRKFLTVPQSLRE